MFIPGGSCCLSCGILGDSSHCLAVVTCLLSEGATSLRDPFSLAVHSLLLLSPHPTCVFHVKAALPLAPLHSETPGGGRFGGGERGQSHKHGLHGSQPHHASLSSAGTSGSHHLPFCLLRKRTHSPSSKDEQSIGLKDSLLAHSSDPVEMRRLNYQTPGKATPSAGLPSPGLQAPGVSVEGPWPCAPFPFLCPSSCIIHLVEVTEEPLFPTAGQAPQGPGASQGKPRCLGFASSLV